MITKNLYNLKKFCCEEISLIENYNEAVNDTTQIWDCHHRKEIELNKKVQELIDMGLYYNRPASELIFLPHNEHLRMHMKIRWQLNPIIFTDEFREKMSKLRKGQPKTEEWKIKIGIGNKGKTKGRVALNKGVPQPKYKWETPSSEIIIMDIGNVHRWHPDWIKIGEA